MKQKGILPKLPFLFICIFLFFAVQPAFAEDIPAEEVSAEENASVEEAPSNPFLEHSDFVLELTPSIFHNTGTPSVRAPSAFFFPLSAGLCYNFTDFFSIESMLSFFYNYYLISEDKVVISEIENRTAVALSLMLSIPVVFSFDLFAKSKLEVCTGPAFLFRLPLLAPGVDSNDSGFYGTAASDVNYMMHWFYESGRFLYFNLKFSWLFSVDQVKFGPVVSLEIPAVTIFTDKNLNGFIVSAGLKIVY